MSLARRLSHSEHFVKHPRINLHRPCLFEISDLINTAYETRLTSRGWSGIITRVRDIYEFTMYETEYEFTYESYTHDLYEMCEYLMRDTYNDVQDTYEIDDEYARDTCDYNELAYRHYA